MAGYSPQFFEAVGCDVLQLINRTIIESIRVEGSGFLRTTSVDFAAGLNCIIGPRGTGKTSLLELIRFATGREPSEPEKAAPFADLIEAALGDSGWVELDVRTRYGQLMTIRRFANTTQRSIRDGESGEELDGIDWPPFDRYDVAIFSQNELEEVSVNPEARREVLDSFCGQEILRVRDELSDIARRLDVNAMRRIQVRNEEESLKAHSEQLPKLRLELDTAEKAYQEMLATMAAQESDKRVLDELATKRQLLTIEDELLRGLLREAEVSLAQEFPGQALGSRLSATLSEDTIANLISHDRLRSLRKDLAQATAQYRSLREQMSAHLEQMRELIAAAHAETDLSRREVETDYKARATQLGALSKKWQEVSGRRDGLLNQVRSLELVEDQIRERAGIEDQLAAERQALLDLQGTVRGSRFRIREDAAGSLNEQIGGSVRVRVEENGDLDQYRQFLFEALKGSGMWYSRIVAPLSRQIPPSKLAQLAREGDAEALAKLAGLDAERAGRVLAAAGEPQVASRLETVEVEDSVALELRMSDGSYSGSESLSQGQRCTTILSILLVDSENPLIVDQPEDNLDNAYVVESVVDVLNQQSLKRQFVFVTHNPNIAVLAGASQVIAMTAKDGRGELKAVGPWDSPDVKEQILTVMEGGAAAFNRRRSAYALTADASDQTTDEP